MNVPLIVATNIVEEIKMNSDLRKRYLEGPVYKFKDKDVLCIVTYSSGGGMNQLVLMQYLKKMDEFGLHDRSMAQPAVLLDGHSF